MTTIDRKTTLKILEVCRTAQRIRRKFKFKGVNSYGYFLAIIRNL